MRSFRDIFFIFLIIPVITHAEENSAGLAGETLDSTSEFETQIEWTVYEMKDFDKTELCQVLSCKPSNLCLTKNEDAICVESSKLNEIPGKKRFYKIYADQNPEIITDQKTAEKISKNQPMASHERHASKMGPYKDCTDLELRSIKGRLFKWFSDIHGTQKNEPGYELPKHEISCHQDVGFMFFTMDGDKTGKLGVNELHSLDNDPHEKCVKSFLDRCDVDSDDYLSLDEWCSCFRWSDDDHHEPACHAALRKHDPHDPKSFSPECDAEGFFKLDQCQKGKCWCVDKWGREFDRSRKNGKVNCQNFV